MPMARLKIFMSTVIFLAFLWLLCVGLPELASYSPHRIIVPDRQLPQVVHPFLIDGIWEIQNSTMNASSSWSKMSIPKILHQTFPTEMVYETYLPLINSCLTLNPDWDYYLWRDSDAEAFIASNYPSFLAKYRSYKDNLERADSIRYIVLHHFGGIYLDMDIECKRPFFPALSHLPAFIDQERTEQSNIFWSMPYSAMNSAMGSAPGHPFYRFMIDAMTSFRRVGNAFDSTGPRLLTQKYQEYSQAVGKDYAKLPPVALLEAKVMSPLMDPGKDWKQKCQFTLRLGIWSIPLVGCRTLQEKNWRLDDSDHSTLAVHRFLHLGYKFKAKSRRQGVNVTRLYPNRVKLFGQPV